MNDNWMEPPAFDFTDNKDDRRSREIYQISVVDSTTRPSAHGMSGRKVVVMFEARNPHGLIATSKNHFGSNIPRQVEKDLNFLLEWGGNQCRPGWPNSSELRLILARLDEAMSKGEVQ